MRSLIIKYHSWLFETPVPGLYQTKSITNNALILSSILFFGGILVKKKTCLQQISYIDPYFLETPSFALSSFKVKRRRTCRPQSLFPARFFSLCVGRGDHASGGAIFFYAGSMEKNILAGSLIEEYTFTFLELNLSFLLERGVFPLPIFNLENPVNNFVVGLYTFCWWCSNPATRNSHKLEPYRWTTSFQLNVVTTTIEHVNIWISSEIKVVHIQLLRHNYTSQTEYTDGSSGWLQTRKDHLYYWVSLC